MLAEADRKVRDEQARQRLVEFALATAKAAECELQERGWCKCEEDAILLAGADYVRRLAGFKDSSKGHWCAAGLTAAMAQAGLLVPAPGTPARRGAIALLDWVARSPGLLVARPDADGIPMYFVDAQPGDIIAWLQHPPPDPAGWRRGHVAVIVATDSESITTVGWNEGPRPGRVMLRRLWRKPHYEVPMVPPQNTVLLRRPGGLYGIARPVAA